MHFSGKIKPQFRKKCHTLPCILTLFRNNVAGLGHPLFFPLFSVVRPTQIFAFSKKQSYAEGNEGNDTLFQTIVTLI